MRDFPSDLQISYACSDALAGDMQAKDGWAVRQPCTACTAGGYPDHCTAACFWRRHCTAHGRLSFESHVLEACAATKKG